MDQSTMVAFTKELFGINFDYDADKNAFLMKRGGTSTKADEYTWLTEFMASPKAWAIGLLMMYEPVKIYALHGADVIVHKITRDWGRLTGDQQTFVVKTIMDRLVYSDVSVLNKVCECLSRVSLQYHHTAHKQIAFHSVPTHWPNLLEDLLFLRDSQNESNRNTSLAYLRAVRILVEEVTKDTTIRSVRTRLRHYLIENSHVTINSILQLFGPSLYVEGMKALLPWTSINMNVGDLYSNLFDLFIDKTLNAPIPETVILCCEGITNLLDQPELDKYPSLFEKMTPSILAIAEYFCAATRENYNSEASEQLGLIVCKFASTSPKTILTSQYGPTYLHHLNNCLEHPLASVVDAACTGWLDVLEGIQDEDNLKNHTGYKEIFWQTSLLAFTRLNAMTFGEDDDLSFVIPSLSDVIRECYVLFDSKLAEYIRLAFLTHLNATDLNPHSRNALLTGDLIAIRALVEQTQEGETMQLADPIIANCTRLPEDVKTHVACLQLMTELAEVLPISTTKLKTVLDYALNMLSQVKFPDLTKAAASLFKELSYTCARHLMPEFDNIIGRLSFLHDLSPDSRKKTLEAVAGLVSSLPMRDHDRAKQLFFDLTDFMRKELDSAFTHLNGLSEDVHENKICCEIDCLTAVMKCHPNDGTVLVPAFEATSNILRLLLEKFWESSKLTACCSRFFQACIFAMQLSIYPYISPLIDVTILMQKMRPYSSEFFKDIYHQLVVVFTKQKPKTYEEQDMLVNYQNALSTQITRGLLQIPPPNDPNCPVYIQDYYSMMRALLSTMPAPIMCTEFTPRWHDIMKSSRELLIRPRNVNATAVMTEFLSHAIVQFHDYNNYPLAQEMQEHYYQHYLETILEAISKCEKDTVAPYNMALYQIAKSNPHRFDEVASGLLKQNGFPTDKISEEAKKEHLVKWIRSMASDFGHVSTSFMLACKGHVTRTYQNLQRGK